MLELMLCSSLTLLPDFLIRRFVQGKRLGKEITLFSVWYELRWGITLCLILTVLLITVVLYNHPSSKDVNALFRTTSIFAETGGRVSEVYVGYNQKVKKGEPLFKLDGKRQEADIEICSRPRCRSGGKHGHGQGRCPDKPGEARRSQESIISRRLMNIIPRRHCMTAIRTLSQRASSRNCKRWWRHGKAASTLRVPPNSRQRRAFRSSCRRRRRARRRSLRQPRSSWTE